MDEILEENNAERLAAQSEASLFTTSYLPDQNLPENSNKSLLNHSPEGTNNVQDGWEGTSACQTSSQIESEEKPPMASPASPVKEILEENNNAEQLATQSEASVLPDQNLPENSNNSLLNHSPEDTNNVQDSCEGTSACQIESEEKPPMASPASPVKKKFTDVSYSVQRRRTKVDNVRKRCRRLSRESSPKVCAPNENEGSPVAKEEDSRTEFPLSSFVSTLRSVLPGVNFSRQNRGNKTFNRGDFVWGKMKFFSWWPAMILNPEDCGIKNSNPNKYILFWFADHSISQVLKQNVSAFEDNFTKKVQKMSKKQSSKEAVKEALSVLAKANDLTFDSETALIKWANEGFPATVNWEVTFQWTKPDLPQLIQKALLKDTETSSDESDAEDNVKKMIEKVKKGEKSLEEICIGCCEENVTLVEPHPLFLGKVCTKCKKDVNRANKLPCGDFNNYCIICGQGGTLLYCSKKTCCRAFCKECIQYLHSEEAFSKISHLDKWPCYICQPFRRKHCLINVRPKLKLQLPVPDAPAAKRPCHGLSDNKIDNVKKMIEKVLKEEKSLEEICIGCCEENVTLAEPHPLFLGKVCTKCKKDVNRANKLPCGAFNNYCIICGQGGTLLYCSKKMCSRAFCKECIQYLDSEEAFSKICLLDKWPCYICEPVKRQNCLIKIRPTKRKLQNLVPDIAPAAKRPCNTQSDSKIGLVIKDLLTGTKDLEDVCIACCKESVELICKHPLFVGKVCRKCIKDVMKVCSLPSGHYHNFCIICGQGGYLVYCSNDTCSRAFCKECIEYLDSAETFSKITSIDKWPCFLCEPVKRQRCLIRKRAIIKQEAQTAAANQVPVSNSTKHVQFVPAMKSNTQTAVAANQVPAMKRNARIAVTPNQVPVSKPVNSLIDVVIYEILRGYKDLEDVCIACCNPMVILVCNHPLLMGKICKGCRKDVMKVCSLPTGKHHNFCIVCGVGGSIVYCSDYKCFRAYCQQCIEYLDCEKRAYEKIVKADFWFCYLCKPGLHTNSLIKKRVIHVDLADVDTPPTSPDVEEPSTNKIASYAPACQPLSLSSSNNTTNDDDCVILDSVSPASDKTATASDIAADNKRFKNFADSCSKTSLFIKTASDNAADNNRFRHFAASSCSKTYRNYSAAASDNAADKRYQHFAASSCSKTSLFIKEPSVDTAADETFMDYSSASFFDNAVDDIKFVKSLAATSKTSSTKKGRSISGIIVEHVREGKRYLEDICIACLKNDAEAFLDHPYFVGSLCVSCHQDVLRVCYELSPEERKNFCLICGQEGDSLLHCRYKSCNRAYCEICVGYLDSERGAFAMNVQDKEWACYLSEAYCKYSSMNDNFLIKQRKTIKHESFTRKRRYSRKGGIPVLEGDSKTNILKGAINLEDICIACHKGEYELKEKSNVNLVVHHPLFFGSICESCIQDVEEACQLRYGKLQDVCIVCGKGGSLVYCSKRKCSRAYCQQCIEYLDSKEAFVKIVENTNWKCYYCKSCRSKNCLIKKRFPPDNYRYPDEKRLEVYIPPELSTEDIGKKLWEGELTLKDVCIACLELITNLSMDHPLFKGKVCLHCIDEVYKACNLETGTDHDQCVVCGQGGELVYCCNTLCSKAYCSLCIEYLDDEKAYPKILKNKEWYCYFCDLHPPSKCFLQRKEIHRSGLIDFPSVPKKKMPINVLSFNDTGRQALGKARICVGNYHLERISRSYKPWIQYNLILGSFFVEDETKSKKEISEDFFNHFESFNNRLIDCSFLNTNNDLYFYIFIGDYHIMDADIVCRVTETIHMNFQYSFTVLPVPFQFGEKKFLAWSNLSCRMPSDMIQEDDGPYIDRRKIRGGPYIDNQNVEKKIINRYLNYLKEYFQSE